MALDLCLVGRFDPHPREAGDKIGATILPGMVLFRSAPA